MDCIIQAIEAIAGLEEKAEELVRMADIINEEEEYEVEEIRGHCKKGRGTQFLVH